MSVTMIPWNSCAGYRGREDGRQKWEVQAFYPEVTHRQLHIFSCICSGQLVGVAGHVQYHSHGENGEYNI